MKRVKIVGREDKIREVQTFLGIAGKVPSNMLASGDPGTGKTTVMEYCNEDWRPDPPVRRSYLKLTDLPRNSQAKAIFDKLVDDLRPRDKAITFSDCIRVIKQEIERSSLLVFLDDPPSRHVDFCLNTLCRLNQDAQGGFISIVVISNDHDIESSLHSPTISAAQLHRVFFPPYQVPELIKILRLMIQEYEWGEVPKETLQQIAAFTSIEKNGDARVAMRILESYYLQKRDIENILKDYQSGDLIRGIEVLQYSEKVFLYCLCNAVYEKGKVTIEQLHNNYVQSVSKTLRQKPVSYRQFHNIGIHLLDKNLICLSPGGGQGKKSKVWLRSSLEKNLEELTKLLEIELGIEEGARQEADSIIKNL